MALLEVIFSVCALAPPALMASVALLCGSGRAGEARLWQAFHIAAGLALISTVASAAMGGTGAALPASLHPSTLGLILAMLVQFLGTVIGGFSARYLQGEAGQRRYICALAMALAAVQLLLLSDHWVLLITTWMLAGAALQRLLCFYPARAFARLAAHKKQIADRIADGLLISAAALAWMEVGSGSLSDLWTHVGTAGMSPALHASAMGVALAVILRTALLPVHGWIIQVMEAPTPVSALLHAGVINLGGFWLIRFAPLLEQAMPARILLLAFGLATAALAGMVMLTRISIKVRLAWSTVAQMGFLLLECALGLYSLAALHLIGHSLYKAHAFLSASTVVRQTRLQTLYRPAPPAVLSLAIAPILTILVVLTIQHLAHHTPWPWWWSAVLGLSWAPLLWWPSTGRAGSATFGRLAFRGVLTVSVLTLIALLAHALPLGIQTAPHSSLGGIALLGMFGLYLGLAQLQRRPQTLSGWRRWSYAGFYVDEAYTRMALRLWPATHRMAEDLASVGPDKTGLPAMETSA